MRADISQPARISNSANKLVVFSPTHRTHS